MQASGLFTSSVKTRLTDRIVGDVDSLLLNVRATDAHTVTRFGPARCLNWSTSSAGLRMRLQTLGQSQEVGNAHKMNETSSERLSTKMVHYWSNVPLPRAFQGYYYLKKWSLRERSRSTLPRALRMPASRNSNSGGREGWVYICVM